MASTRDVSPGSSFMAWVPSPPWIAGESSYGQGRGSRNALRWGGSSKCIRYIPAFRSAPAGCLRCTICILLTKPRSKDNPSYDDRISIVFIPRLPRADFFKKGCPLAHFPPKYIRADAPLTDQRITRSVSYLTLMPPSAPRVLSLHPVVSI